jgi:hypothetical protein
MIEYVNKYLIELVNLFIFIYVDKYGYTKENGGKSRLSSEFCAVPYLLGVKKP